MAGGSKGEHHQSYIRQRNNPNKENAMSYYDDVTIGGSSEDFGDSLVSELAEPAPADEVTVGGWEDSQPADDFSELTYENDLVVDDLALEYITAEDAADPAY